MTYNPMLVTVEIIQNGKVLPSVVHNGQTFVQTPSSGEYEIRLQNLTIGRKKVVVSVDGLNVVNGQEASLGGQGYLLSGRETLNVKGFLRSNDECARFTFTEASTSYTAKIGNGTSNTGVIGIAVFDEYIAPYRPTRYSFSGDDFLGGLTKGKSSGGLSPRSMSLDLERVRVEDGDDGFLGIPCGAAAACAAPEPSSAINYSASLPKMLGTGYGRAESFHTQKVDFKVASNTPSSVLTLRYATAETLRSWGVPVPTSLPSPNAFPANQGFAPPPADWRR